MDHPPDENPGSPAGRRAFSLTPKPQAEPGGAPAPGAGKSRRGLLIGGAAIPFATTIASRSAFACAAGTNSCATSMTAGMSHTTMRSVRPRGDTVEAWRENYPRLRQNHTVEARAFPAAVSGKGYLRNPALAGVFRVPGASVNGVALRLADADLHAALHGRGVWEIAVTRRGEVARRRMDGRFFAEATAAVLNAAAYGERSFGMNDAMVIQHVNRTLLNLQSKARVLAELNPAASAGDILGQLVGNIEGGAEIRGETYYLTQMNAQGRA
jgi:hypothetical protein